MEHAADMAARVLQTEQSVEKLALEMERKAERVALANVIRKKADVAQVRAEGEGESFLTNRHLLLSWFVEPHLRTCYARA